MIATDRSIRLTVVGSDAASLFTLVVATAAVPEAVRVSVSDTGPGLPEDVAERLFEPFVSTKRHGMGVGLSLCRSIVEEHGGRLWAEANPGGGAVFRFTLPAAPPEAGPG